ncbi:MAG: DUF3429 domain-containing protein [Aquabacterium sp.]|nr:MAG: DUF3429 domain-containing protein [Aquabacterium sp.]
MTPAPHPPHPAHPAHPAAHPAKKVHLAPSHPGPVAAMLAYAGTLPFILGAALVWIVNARAHEHAMQLLALYAAAVVSFLGGIHWGLAMRADSGESNADRRLSWGVAPAIVAWIAALMPPYAGLVVQGGMLIACYLVDRRAYPQWGAAAWLVLRFRLTAVAALCCFLGAAGA